MENFLKKITGKKEQLPGPLSETDSKKIGELYSEFLRASASVDRDWQMFFAGFEFARNAFSDFNANKSSEKKDEQNLTDESTDEIRKVVYPDGRFAFVKNSKKNGAAQNETTLQGQSSAAGTTPQRDPKLEAEKKNLELQKKELEKQRRILNAKQSRLLLEKQQFEAEKLKNQAKNEESQILTSKGGRIVCATTEEAQAEEDFLKTYKTYKNGRK